MAKIKDIASHHKVTLDIKDKPLSFIQPTLNPEKKEGRLRRTWLEDNFETVQKETGLKQGLNRVKDLRGNPFKIMLYLANIISSEESEESYVTEKISVTDIAENTGLSRESVKTAIKFLIKNKLIVRLNSRTGLHGWASYQLLESLSDDFIKQGLNRVKTGGISSSNYNKTTTTEEENKTLINIEALRNIGFTYSHVTQILNQQKLTVEMIQDSIYAFAYDLNYNKKALIIKGSPLNYFMGILRVGQVYAPPANYESPEHEAMRLYLECKKAQEAQKQKMEEEIFNIHLNDWINTLSELKIKTIAPKYDPEKGVGFMIRGSLIEYFKQYEWPKLKVSCLNK